MKLSWHKTTSVVPHSPVCFILWMLLSTTVNGRVIKQSERFVWKFKINQPDILSAFIIHLFIQMHGIIWNEIQSQTRACEGVTTIGLQQDTTNAKPQIYWSHARCSRTPSRYNLHDATWIHKRCVLENATRRSSNSFLWQQKKNFNMSV